MDVDVEDGRTGDGVCVAEEGGVVGGGEDGVALAAGRSQGRGGNLGLDLLAVDGGGLDDRAEDGGPGDVQALPAAVSVNQAAELRAEGAFVLDVREPSEWLTGHIPDATLIPLGQLAGRVGALPTDRTSLPL